LVTDGEDWRRRPARSKTATLRREFASDDEANSRQSSVRRVALGVRLDLSSPFEANSRRMGERDRSNRRRRRTGSSPSLNAGVSVSRSDPAGAAIDRLLIG
jgi:hypothetical protein